MTQRVCVWVRLTEVDSLCVWRQDQRVYSKVSGWSCECVVLSSLVTFNVPIDVLSTYQRGHSRERERESFKIPSAEERQCSARHTNVGWPGFQKAPQVPNTARNTDGLWVIHRGASRDTNNLPQHDTSFLELHWFYMCNFCFLNQSQWTTRIKANHFSPKMNTDYIVVCRQECDWQACRSETDGTIKILSMSNRHRYTDWQCNSGNPLYCFFHYCVGSSNKNVQLFPKEYWTQIKNREAHKVAVRISWIYNLNIYKQYAVIVASRQ